MNNKINDIIKSEKFKKDIKDAIESGKSVDYVFDGEDEIGVDVFESDTAVNAVINCLKKHFKNKKQKTKKNKLL